MVAVPIETWARPHGPVISVLARDLRNGWGICGRPEIDASADAYASMMNLIGTRDIRTPLVQGGRSAIHRLEELRTAMQRARISNPAPRVTALVTAYLNDPVTTWRDQQPALLAMAATGMLRAIEGPNEINNRQTGGGTHGPDDLIDRTAPQAFPANFLAWSQAVSRFRGENTASLRDVAIVAPSIASGLRSDYAMLPDVSKLADAGNLHFTRVTGASRAIHSGTMRRLAILPTWLPGRRPAEVPDKPVWLTETGASTSGMYARDGVSQAEYLANQFFDYFASGGSRLFYYQLIDGSGLAGEVEGNFGLFRRDGSPKPAAVMLGSLKNLLSLGDYEDPRNLRDAGPVPEGYDASALSVSGLRNAGQAGPGYLVIYKTDGSSMIAVWNEPPIDDGKGGSNRPATNIVTLDFGSVQTFSIHDLMASAPLTGTTPRGTQFDTGRTTVVALHGYPMLVELRPRSNAG